MGGVDAEFLEIAGISVRADVLWVAGWGWRSGMLFDFRSAKILKFLCFGEKWKKKL